MDPASRKSLTAAERELLRTVEPKRLRKLDEDDLIDVHRRVRRARDKYAKLYRRQAAKQVHTDKTRAQASKSAQRTAAGAELFEDALATVSERLAKLARVRSEELRAARLAAAIRPKRRSVRPRRAQRATKSGGSSRERRQRRTPVRKRAAASSRAASRRHQAKRAAR
jgi:hypothetical protein